MKLLIYSLILFFILLLIYQIYNAHFRKSWIIEGLENETTASTTASGSDSGYQAYDISNNTLILAQQNAGNIQNLKQQIDQLLDMQKEVDDMSANVITMSQQIQGLAQQQATAANYMNQNKTKTMYSS